MHTGVVHAGVARATVVGTLSQSDYTRVVCKDMCARVAHAGGGRDTQPIRLHRVACAGVVCRDCAQGLCIVIGYYH